MSHISFLRIAFICFFISIMGLSGNARGEELDGSFTIGTESDGASGFGQITPASCGNSDDLLRLKEVFSENDLKRKCEEFGIRI